MSTGATPEPNRHRAIEGHGALGAEARLRELVELYRTARGGHAPGDDDLRRLVEEDQARRLLNLWKTHTAALGAELATINAALDGAGVRLEPNAMEPGPGVSYIACVEIGIGGKPRGSHPCAFAALTRRAEARLQIRMPGSIRHETRYVPLSEIDAEVWKGWLLDLLEANRAWQHSSEWNRVGL